MCPPGPALRSVGGGAGVKRCHPPPTSKHQQLKHLFWGPVGGGGGWHKALVVGSVRLLGGGRLKHAAAH